jgi:ABC-type transport system involved in multi-copper enzyme maturation permease subunit
MTVFPVIVRELRAQARQPFSYSLRMLGVLALLGGGAAFALRSPFAANMGGALFGYLQLTLILAIWILVPLSAADCISRERREGTLPLLFLTPLKSVDIVIAKSLVHGLRAGTLLIAVLPILTIPFLLGGVSWQQAATSALYDFNSICWALAAAILASSRCRNGLRAIVMAMVFAVFGWLLFLFVMGLLTNPMRLGRWPGFNPKPSYLQIQIVGANYRVVSPRIATPVIGGIMTTWVLRVMLKTAAVSVAVLTLAVMLAAWQIRRSWREEPPPMWVQSWQKKLCTPVVATVLFRRWMRWKLRRNPIGWLEQRTWQGRLVTWSWFAIIISIYSAYFTDKMLFRNFSSFQQTLAWLMMGSIASSAAGSFRRERESGVLELLLVAPLTTRQIIGGRLRGLWGQFLPALGILLGVWLYFDTVFKTHEAGGPVLFFSITFLTLPVIGLYFSVRARNFLSAFLLTLACGLIAPMVVERLAGFCLWAYGYRGGFAEIHFGPLRLASLMQLGLAVFLGGHLRRRLETRTFPLERTTT